MSLSNYQPRGGDGHHLLDFKGQIKLLFPQRFAFEVLKVFTWFQKFKNMLKGTLWRPVPPCPQRLARPHRPHVMAPVCCVSSFAVTNRVMTNIRVYVSLCTCGDVSGENIPPVAALRPRTCICNLDDN